MDNGILSDTLNSIIGTTDHGLFSGDDGLLSGNTAESNLLSGNTAENNLPEIVALGVSTNFSISGVFTDIPELDFSV
ncbi:hypothetical protein [Azotobacter armeniacus]